MISVNAQIRVLSEKRSKFEDHKKDLKLMDEEKTKLILEKLLWKLWTLWKLGKLLNAGFSEDVKDALEMEQ